MNLTPETIAARLAPDTPTCLLTQEIIVPLRPGFIPHWHVKSGALVLADELLVTCTGSDRKKTGWTYTAPWPGVLTIEIPSDIPAKGASRIGRLRYGELLEDFLASRRKRLIAQRDDAESAMQQLQTKLQQAQEQTTSLQATANTLREELARCHATDSPAQVAAELPSPTRLLDAVTERLTSMASPESSPQPPDQDLARRLLRLLLQLDAAAGEPLPAPSPQSLEQAIEDLYQPQETAWMAKLTDLDPRLVPVLKSLWRHLKHQHLQALLKEQNR
jgi:hypothetical protein